MKPTFSNLILKITKRVLIIVVAFLIVNGFMTTASVIIENQLAINQLENNNWFFMIMTSYDNFIIPIITFIPYIFVIWFSIYTIIDILKLAKEYSNND